MSTSSASIDNLRIATPCPVGWEQMTGDQRVRFCDQCQLKVYNIAELSRPEVEKLIASSEGRICAKLYRRADGTVITKDCPVGLRALRLRVSKRVAAIFAAMVSLTGVALGQNPLGQDEKTGCTPQTRITRTDAGADTNSKSLSGTVLDPTGAGVPGATITIKHAETGDTQTTTTDGAGRFSFASPAGNYSLSILAAGFKSLQILNVTLEPKNVINLESIIELSDEPFIGIVDTALSSLDTRTPGTTIINEQMIRRLPIQ